MRRKIFIGLFLAATVGISAGEFLFSRSGAQDVPKKAEEKKSDNQLFEILQKDLEAKGKKDAPKAVVIPGPSGLELPPPLANDLKPGQLPALPGLGAAPQTVPPPAPPTPGLPTPSALPTVKEVTQPSVDPIKETAVPTVDEKPLPAPKPTEPVKPAKEDVQITFPPLNDVKPAPTSPVPTPQPSLPPPVTVKPALEPVVKPETTPVNPPVPKKGDASRYESQGYPKAAFENMVDPAPASQKQAINVEVAKLKNCPWSLQVDMIDGQTVVVASINKKHEFRIVCQSLDLQTGKHTLKASGKVQISGDMITGSCEHLAISLTEDRLVLEGGAAVTIQKVATNVSDARPAAFELKGDNLNLRISELDSSKIQQTSWQKSPVDLDVKLAAALAPATNDKRWTAYGRLVRNEAKEGPEWRLMKSNGEVIAHLMAREGGTLERFAGQTISVYGTNEEVNGTKALRVTHIALP